jgi:hypothetical protein
MRSGEAGMGLKLPTKDIKRNRKMIVYLEEWSNGWKIATDDKAMLFDDVEIFVDECELGSSIKITVVEMTEEEFDALQELEGCIVRA